MENLIASDPGERNIFGLVVSDQLRLAAQSLRLARRVGIVTGFFIPAAGAGETDGPPGAKAVGRALEQLGIRIDYITDALNAPLLAALGLHPIISAADYLAESQPTHLISIERVGRGRDNRYRNMHGDDITRMAAPLDDLFLEAARRGLTTVGIGDGGNEIGMGKVFAAALESIPHGKEIASTVPTDFCIAAGVSNWGAYGLAGALSVLAGRDLLPTPAECIDHVERIVREAGAVDGRTHRCEPTVDGLPISASVRMLEDIRRLIAPSPLERSEPVVAGILGYGEAGRAAARLLTARGHRVRISDQQSVTLEPGLCVDGVETGRHTIDFFNPCDLVVASPGIRSDTAIVADLHRAGVPLMSELEMAYQLCDRPLIAVTGTIGKRTTVELLQRLFAAADQPLSIGGNKGLPLSALLSEVPSEAMPADHQYRACQRDEGTKGRRDEDQYRQRERAGLDSARLQSTIDNRQSTISKSPIALAVSSFQLENVVHFRPHIAILLNIDEHHLDRHRSVAEYIRIKSRIFMNHRPDDVLILPFDDERLRSLARKHHGRTFFISRRQEVDRGAWLAGGRLCLNLEGEVEELPLGRAADYPFAENLLAAVLTARLFGIGDQHQQWTFCLDHDNVVL
jgi:hypothetical protein